MLNGRFIHYSARRTGGVFGQQAYNQTFGTYNWLIQLLWENSRGGGCDKTLAGKFYSR